MCNERRVGRIDKRRWSRVEHVGLGEGEVGGWTGEVVYWEGCVIWLWCEWEGDWRRGCGEIWGGGQRMLKGEGNVVG